MQEFFCTSLKDYQRKRKKGRKTRRTSWFKKGAPQPFTAERLNEFGCAFDFFCIYVKASAKAKDGAGESLGKPLGKGFLLGRAEAAKEDVGTAFLNDFYRGKSERISVVAACHQKRGVTVFHFFGGCLGNALPTAEKKD